jgi:GAF domain-containing protein/DNA-binding CsgD family transcriptional regulator
VLGRIRRALSADAVVILLPAKSDEATEDGPHLVERARSGLPQELEPVRIPIRQGVPDWILARGEPITVDDLPSLEGVCRPLGETLQSLLGALLVVEGRMTGDILVGTLLPRRFAEADVRLLQLIADRIALALEHARLYEEEQRTRAQAEAAQRRLAVLAEVSELLTTLLDYEPTLQSVARLSLPTLADLCIVDVVEEDGEIRQVALAHMDPVRAEQVREARARKPVKLNSVHLVAEVLRTGRPQVHAAIPDSLLMTMAGDAAHLRILRALDLQSAMALPLMPRGQVLGAISFWSSVPQRFGPADLALAEEMARRIALAIDNARLYREARLMEARYRGLFWKGLQNLLGAPEAAAWPGARLTRLAEQRGADRTRAHGPAALPPALLDQMLIEVPLSPLTPREREVLDALVAGASTREIANRLVVSEHAVRYHLKNLFAKLQVHSRGELVAYALRVGLARSTEAR